MAAGMQGFYWTSTFNAQARTRSFDFTQGRLRPYTFVAKINADMRRYQRGFT